MTPFIEQFVNHIWQSTLLLAFVGLLTLFLRKNRAQVRYGIWFVASMKFLVPFALLTAFGSQFAWQTASPLADTPVAVIVDGTMPTERTVLSTLGTLAADLAAHSVVPPAIIVVGEVVAVARPAHYGRG